MKLEAMKGPNDVSLFLSNGVSFCMEKPHKEDGTIFSYDRLLFLFPLSTAADIK